MGGTNSGRRYRWGARDTTGQYNRVDIRYLNKNGWMKPGTDGTLSWSRDGEPAGNIRFTVDDDCLHLIYKSQTNGEGWINHHERVSLDTTSCHLGGSRKWLLCPHCNKRVAILYGGARFLCRHCHNLSYQSQNEDVADGLQRKTDKLAKLFDWDEDGEFYNKPRNMHWKTFERLSEKYQQAGEAADAALLMHLAPMLGMDEFSDLA